MLIFQFSGDTLSSEMFSRFRKNLLLKKFLFFYVLYSDGLVKKRVVDGADLHIGSTGSNE